jgi:hypothetical protein
MVFGAVIVVAGLYIAYVLWPRWPYAPVALDAPSVPIVISGTVLQHRTGGDPHERPTPPRRT